MSNSNKTYRINTKVGVDRNNDINLNLNVLQEYDVLEVLSLKIGTENVYRTHTSGYGCIVGRVLANGGVGVPNAKISIFIEVNNNTSTDDILYNLYPYKTTRSKNSEHIRYNLLPDEKVSVCHQIIGTFPNKRLVLDDKNMLEIFENYYKFTTVTNESGDYMLFGIPTGNQTLHMDLDLSDIGFLSQKPIDMKFKGYNNTLFENPKQFKIDSNIDNLVQVITQSSPVYIKPFWGEEDGEEVGITRHDIDINYKFEPTCIFMGSMVSEPNGNGFSKKCIPSRDMGKMEKLITGHGTIEMIRKKIDGSVEEYPIMGNNLIDENGVWCYQIPMNLDYVITDEYGNLVPTDNPEKGLPTRTRVRFRISKSEYGGEYGDNHLAKVLVPNNPQDPKKIDYVFGSLTEDNDEGDESFRDLLWNNVYTVKSHIPRIQKGNNQRTEKFSGIKNVNVTNNNHIPYNNMRVNISFMFTLQCAIIKALIYVIKAFNVIYCGLISALLKPKKHGKCLTIGDGLCPELEGWYFAPGCDSENKHFFDNTLDNITKNDDIGKDENIDTKSINKENSDSDEYGICLTDSTDYFIQCIEINLAMENNVIQFDFYNDWINGLIYIPRWFVNIKRKGSFLFGLIRTRSKIQACMEDTFNKSRRYVQQCSMGYSVNNSSNSMLITSTNGCHKNNNKHKCHKKPGRRYVKIFGSKGGIIHKESTLKGQSVYYLKPCEILTNNKKCNLYATDIVLLGNINKCNMYGIPSDFDNMLPTTYQLPPVLVQTNMDSDGVLYVLSDGSSKCIKNQKFTESIKPIEQNFKAYEQWSMGEEPIEDITEYGVTEISGIDWGLNGPNQGQNDTSTLYFPGGHFLGISCANAAVNTKSCVNLSRLCEMGVMMSQRQSKISYKTNEVGEIEMDYKYIIPTGFISKDEITDNNYRNIFATLNHNRLKTKKNKYGLREYDFTPLLPINFNGEFKNKISNVNYNNKKVDDPSGVVVPSPIAYTRTIEENSGDYMSFRFGDVGKKLSNKFLTKEDGKYYLPSYENSYYFYYGLKNGATALDIFLTDYFAECPTRGESIQPEIKIVVTDKIICKKGSLVNFEIKNIPIPFNYKIYDADNTPICGISDYEMSKFDVANLEIGEYTVEIENSKIGLTLTKMFNVYEKLPTSPEDSNLYEDSCRITSINFDETPRINYNSIIQTFSITPANNGGIIFVTMPSATIESGKEPYIYGFAITCDKHCVCYSYNTKTGGDARIYETLTNNTNFEYIWLRNIGVKEVNNEESLYDVPDNTLYILTEGETTKISFKGWAYNTSYNFYVCYSPTFYSYKTQLKLLSVDDVEIGVNNRKMAYYIYDESVTLSEIALNKTDSIFYQAEPKEERIVGFNYNKLNLLTPKEEWAIKRALYYDNSFYNGGIGEIQYGVIGGTPPYQERIFGTSEYVRDDGSLEMIEGVDSTIDGSILPISTTEIAVPTIKWLDDFVDENGYVYKKTPYNITIKDKNNVVPYIALMENDKFSCEGEIVNTIIPPSQWLGSNGQELTTLID